LTRISGPTIPSGAVKPGPSSSARPVFSYNSPLPGSHLSSGLEAGAVEKTTYVHSVDKSASPLLDPEEIPLLFLALIVSDSLRDAGLDWWLRWLAEDHSSARLWFELFCADEID
jgi:hypothetical protein